ncbi:MAG: hypothetical protein GF418_08480 [Chitinivibrionales bacterium]|nr:hypothetical protein [Chitinivibrionales bacterium]MBD3395649.1 hypothetical protein [Chitinivibrionales bacterium]
MRNVFIFAISFILTLGIVFIVRAEPAPGDIFREYKWIARALDGTPGDSGTDWISEWPRDGGHGRVGGSLDNMGENRPIPGMDLDGATRAEVVIEKVLCHDQTRGLSISINDNDWILMPLASEIPAEQYNYQHHYFPEAEVPLSQLKTSGNVFKLKVDNAGWWPQNLVYGVLIRIYYDNAKPHPTGSIVSPAAGETIGLNPQIAADATGNVDRVEFIGFYEDYNYKGDGNYRQWQYRWIKGWLKNNLGTATASPFAVTWENDWIPEQPGPMKIMARIVGNDGMIYCTDAVDNISLARPGLTIEMCKPYDVPGQWVTRKGTKTEKFDVSGDLSVATKAQAVCAVWKHESNCEYEVNGTKVGFLRTESLVVTRNEFDVNLLNEGANTLSTLPYGHHGIEFNWPGVVVLVKYGGDIVADRAKSVRADQPKGFEVTSLRDGSFRVNIDGISVHALTLIAPDGRIVFATTVREDTPAVIRPEKLADGAYILRATTDGRQLTRNIVVNR